nr:hypothetical protein [Tanacetum cinerariifolium]
MSDSEESGVTYTNISSPFEELSDIGSPRADDHEHLMLPEILEDPYVEDQPYAEDASPIAQSSEYVPESDFEAHPEDDDDEDPVDYLGDGGDDGDDEEESSEDDDDDDMDIEADEEEEEEEHPAPADSVVVAPTAADQAPSAEETEPFETDESTVVRLLAISSPPASPLSSWSSPPPQIPFPPLPPILSPPLLVLSPAPPPSPIPTSASRREDRPEVTLPPQKRLGIALGPRYEVGESSFAAAARLAGGFRADYGFVATMDREIMRDPEREVGYENTDSWDEIMETLQGAPEIVVGEGGFTWWFKGLGNTCEQLGTLAGKGAKYQAVIACAEKIVRIPWGNETLIIHGDGSNQGNAT